jgi:23S rRNA (cytosine1962-C5)-methyltransferase
MIVAPEPTILRTVAWPDYALVDSGGGRKLERYGRLHVIRPEPQCLWTPRRPDAWTRADAEFDPSDEDEAGNWRTKGKLPESFDLRWNEARFRGRLTSFRHLAFFPEQAANWSWLSEAVAVAGRPRVLNLFGYTGVASLVCAAAGAQVTHVDASKKSVAWARENAELSGLQARWIVEDARKYVQREARRGSQYEGIILDPPKYGRGPGGEVWRLFEDLPEMVRLCAELLSTEARFLVVNAYAARISGLALAGLLQDALTLRESGERGGRIDWGELALVEDAPEPREIGLSFFARWSRP